MGLLCFVRWPTSLTSLRRLSSFWQRIGIRKFSYFTPGGSWQEQTRRPALPSSRGGARRGREETPSPQAAPAHVPRFPPAAALLLSPRKDAPHLQRQPSRLPTCFWRRCDATSAPGAARLEGRDLVQPIKVLGQNGKAEASGSCPQGRTGNRKRRPARVGCVGGRVLRPLRSRELNEAGSGGR